MKQIRNCFHWKGKQIQLRKLLWVSFTVTAVASTMFMGISFYYRFASQSVQTIREGNDTRMAATAEQIGTHLRNMMKISDALYYRVIKDTDLKEVSVTDDFRLIYDMHKDSIESIALFSIDGTLLCSSPSSRLREGFSLQNEAWYDGAMDTEENIRFGAPRVSRIFQTDGNSYTRVIPMSRMVQVTIDGTLQRGVLLVNLRYDTVEDMLKNVLVGGGSYVYLVGDNGNLLYHPFRNELYSGRKQEHTLPFVIAQIRQGTIQTQQQFLCQTIGYTGWYMIGVSGDDIMTLHQWKTASFVLLLMMIFFNVMMLINFYVSRRVTEPLHKLEHAVQKIQAGDLQTKIETSGVYEIQMLSTAIEEMEQHLQQLMNDIVREQEEKRKSDLMVLQNQINPHFLYNTLDVIVWMIENEKSDDAVRVVTALARFFRLSLSRGHSIITISDEVEHVRNYLMIQKMRFKNKFTYTIDVAEEIKSLGTVKLILQPLVENAIYHAMEFMDDDGELTITGKLSNGEVILSVSDNGCGMTPERVQALMNDTLTPTGKGSGVGVKNVRERILLVFGNSYGLRIYSEPDEGTTVLVHFPAIDYDELKQREERA